MSVSFLCGCYAYIVMVMVVVHEVMVCSWSIYCYDYTCIVLIWLILQMRYPPLKYTEVCWLCLCYLTWYTCRKNKIKTTSKMVDYSSRESPCRLDEQHGDGYSPDMADTLRSLKEEIQSCKEDNDIII